jgi:RNA polymerase sigma-70 factor (ECF subfamily)
VSLYRQKEENVFLAELFERYLRFVFLINMKYLRDEDLAKDIAMNVFVKLTDDLKRFEIKNFKSWLHVVAKNACMMHLRSERQSPLLSHETQKDANTVMEKYTDLHPEDEPLKELKLERLEQALLILEPEQKKCVELFYLQDKSYVEVAESTGYTMNQVKSFIQNGKRNLKNHMLANGDLFMFSIILIFLSK